MKRIGVSLLCFLVAFGFAYVLDPNSALLQSPNPLHRGGMFVAYLASVWVPWLTYINKEK
jgi:hypothetical protein